MEKRAPAASCRGPFCRFNRLLEAEGCRCPIDLVPDVVPPHHSVRSESKIDRTLGDLQTTTQLAPIPILANAQCERCSTDGRSTHEVGREDLRVIREIMHIGCKAGIQKAQDLI